LRNSSSYLGHSLALFAAGSADLPMISAVTT
jgi:hypothetical protein